MLGSVESNLPRPFGSSRRVLTASVLSRAPPLAFGSFRVCLAKQGSEFFSSLRRSSSSVVLLSFSIKASSREATFSLCCARVGLEQQTSAKLHQGHAIHRDERITGATGGLLQTFWMPTAMLMSALAYPEVFGLGVNRMGVSKASE